MAIATNSLLYFLIDALRGYTEDFRLLDRANPVLVEMNGSRYSIHISSVHDSGYSRTNEDEVRIQIQRNVIDEQRARSLAGIIALFIGFYPDGSAFVAWDPAHVFSQRRSRGGSVYTRQSHYHNALEHGAALYVSRSNNLNREVSTLALRSEALGFYFENWSDLHGFRQETSVRALVARSSDAIETESMLGTVTEVVDLPEKRVMVTITRKAFARDPKFRDIVMRAYSGACCICGRQLGLVEAAHIVPHSHPDCANHVSNGLALCIEHHRLYDDGLLLPSSNATLHLNVDRVEHLRNIQQTSGLEEVQATVERGYRVPDDAASHPDNAFLERGVRIRLGTDT